MIHETGFRLPEDVGPQPPYHVLIHCLINDVKRNHKIAKLTLDSIKAGYFPLLISDRKDHLDQLELEIKNQSIEFEQHLEIVRLDGDLSRKDLIRTIEAIADQFVTITCQRLDLPREGPVQWLACGNRFKVMKGNGATPYCPRCGWAQDISKFPELKPTDFPA